MRLTKERKAYVAIFCLGLGALAVDRLFFGPAGASAAVPEAELAAPERRAESAAEKPAGPSFGERLALQATWQEGPQQDAFVPADSWVGAGPAAQPGGDAAEEPAFVQAHKLSSVAKPKNSAAGMAIVNGKSIARGQTLDGYTLVELGDADGVQSAVFERGATRVRLEAPDKSGKHKPDKPGG